ALIPVGRFRDRASRPWRPAHAPVEGTQTRGPGSFPPHDPESRDTSGRDSRRTASSGLPPTCSTIVSNKQDSNGPNDRTIRTIRTMNIVSVSWGDHLSFGEGDGRLDTPEKLQRRLAVWRDELGASALHWRVLRSRIPGTPS